MNKVCLGDLITTQKGFAFKSKDYTDSGIGIVRVSDFTQDSIDNSNLVYIDKMFENKYEQYKLKTGDIVIQTVGSWPTNPESVVGKVIKIPKEINNNLLNQNAVKLILIENEIDSKYLYYLLKNTDFSSYIVSCARGAASQASITLDDIKNYKFDKPKIQIQQKIAKILSNYDDLIENNNKRIKILEEMAQKIYKEWFVDFKFPGHETATFKDSELGKIPSDWDVVSVESLLKRLKAKNKYTQDNVLLHGRTVVIDQSTAEFLGFHNNEPDFIATPETPLIIFGDHTCKMQMLVENFSIGPNVIPITSENVPIAFLYYLIDSLIETKEYKRHWNDLISKKVILPNDNLTKYYSKIITPIMVTINHLNHKNMNLKQTRDILLPRLISGEIDVENMEIV